MDEQLTPEEAMRQFAAVAQRMTEIIVEALRPAVEAIMEACRKVYAAIQDEYRVRGAIYGDTDRGMLRWFEEICTIARLRREAAYLEQRQLMLAEIRSRR